MHDMSVGSRILVGAQRQPVECVGTANIWIEEDFCPQTVHIAQEIVVEALDKTTAGDLEVVFFDYNLRGISAPFSTLRDRGILRTLLTENELVSYIRLLK